MAVLKFHKVSTLPPTLEANAFYFVLNATFAEAYLTDSAGTARSIGNSAMINALAGSATTAALADYNLVEIVADIAARNAFVAGKQRNLMLLVLNATGDATVASGAALYAWRESDASFIKLSEYEAMDVALVWGNISGRPASSPSTIDDAVTKRHAHSNAAVLDALGDSAGGLTYAGQPVGAGWQATDW